METQSNNNKIKISASQQMHINQKVSFYLMKIFLVTFRIIGSQILNTKKSAGISIIVLNTWGEK